LPVLATIFVFLLIRPPAQVDAASE